LGIGFSITMTTLEIALLIIVVVLTMVLLGLVYIIKEYSDKLRATRGLVKLLVLGSKAIINCVEKEQKDKESKESKTEKTESYQ
jgi:putative Mn2+ efflux pump MntP